MEMKRDLVELGFEMKLPQKDCMSKVVRNAVRHKHHTELNPMQWVERNKIEPKQARTMTEHERTSKGDRTPTLVRTHLGILLVPAMLQNLITFLVKSRRPRDPVEVATLKIQHLDFVRE